MNLECGHDDCAGLVCAACAVETGRQASELEETLHTLQEEVARLGTPTLIVDGDVPEKVGFARSCSLPGRLYPVFDDLLPRLELIRRYASVWRSAGGPIGLYVAGKLLEVLDADEVQLEVLKTSKVTADFRGGVEGEVEGAADVDPGDRCVKRRRATLGVTP